MVDDDAGRSSAAASFFAPASLPSLAVSALLPPCCCLLSELLLSCGSAVCFPLSRASAVAVASGAALLATPASCTSVVFDCALSTVLECCALLPFLPFFEPLSSAGRAGGDVTAGGAVD